MNTISSNLKISSALPLHLLHVYILIPTRSDDEDDEEEGQEAPVEAVAETVDGEVTASAEAHVKPEPSAEEQPKKKKASARTPSYELHIYSAEELAGFKKREMVADAELLDGASRYIPNRLP
jgi:hypothetical protein